MSRRQGWLVLLGALAVLAGPRTSAAWSPSGHMQIAAFSYDALPEPTRASLVLLLRQHPRFEPDFLSQLPADVTSPEDQARWIFAWAAVWPDLARGQPAFERGNWHYVNLPLSLRQGNLASCRRARSDYPESHRRVLAELERRARRADADKPPSQPSESTRPELTPFGPDEIRPALAWARRTLRNATLPAPERALALSWLLHLVADAHQPLHAVALFSARRFEFGDRGGNEILAQGQSSLHRLWDGLLGDDSSLGFVESAAQRWRQTPQLQALARAARRSLDVEVWLDEDCALARSSVYTPAVLSAVQVAEAGSADAKPEVALDASYLRRAQQAAKRRAVQAGSRLTALLESLLARRDRQFNSEGLRPRP
ncbi:MAG: S1/P1 nuclease [Deltaproteobacteria bacterium]